MPLPITISLSPNTEPDDVRTAWRVLLQPWRWRNKDIISQVEQQLSSKLNNQSVTLCSSGRSALYALLRAYNIGPGDEVILQAFTCVAVPATIVWTKASPVYADINPATYNIDPIEVQSKISDRTKAIIVQHTFGIPGPLDELKQLAQQHNIVLIEDCAHALGATYHGQPIGTIGHAAIFSFGRDKALSSVFGGAVSSSDDRLIVKVSELQKQLKSPPLIWIKQQLLHPILFHWLMPLYFIGQIGKAMLVGFQGLHLLSKAVTAKEKQGEKPKHITYRFPGALAYLLQHQLTKLDRYTARRRAIAETYRTALSHQGSAEPLPDSEPSWLRFPLLVRNPKKLHQLSRQQQILLGDWYSTPLAPSGCNLPAFNYKSGSCPKAEAVAKQVINLPTYFRLTDKQVKKVIKLVHDHSRSIR